MKPATRAYSMTTGEEISLRPTSVNKPSMRETTALREKYQAEGMTWEQAMMRAQAEIKVLRAEWDAKYQQPVMTRDELMQWVDVWKVSGARRDVPFEPRHWIDTNEPKDRHEDERRMKDWGSNE